MRKGKFGIVLCAYPILAFICVILRMPLVWLVLALALFAEKDEWAGRQTAQAAMLSLPVAFFSMAAPWGLSAVNLPFFSHFFSAAAALLGALVYLAAVVLSILGIFRTVRDREADLFFFADLAYRLYGKSRPKAAPFYAAPPQPQSSSTPPPEGRGT